MEIKQPDIEASITTGSDFNVYWSDIERIKITIKNELLKSGAVQTAQRQDIEADTTIFEIFTRASSVRDLKKTLKEVML